MKAIKTLIAIIGMMVALFTNSFAQTPSTGDGGGNAIPVPAVPDRLPIGDVADMQAMAWEKVAQIGMWGWASSAIRSTTSDQSNIQLKYIPADGIVDIEEIFNIIRMQRLLLSVLYPSDSINLQVGLYDTDGNNLFYSYSSGMISLPQNGVSENLLKVVLEMNSEIWIPFSGAEWFQIVERDENGNPIRYYYSGEYDSQNGKIRFPLYFAGKSGEVRVTLQDGTEVAYTLNGGKKIIPTDVSVGIGNVSALGVRTFRSTNVIYVSVSKEESERNINPLVQFVQEFPVIPGCTGTNGFSSTTGQPCAGNGNNSVALAAWRTVQEGGDGETTTVEMATRVKIWRQGQLSGTVPWTVIGPSNYIVLPIDNGRYWIKFDFSSGWPFGNQFNPPYQGGGQAVPVTPAP